MSHLKFPLVQPFDLSLPPRMTLVHELRVALCSCYDHVHPDPHGLCRRSHHVVQSVMGLYTEGQGGVGALMARHKSEISHRSNPFQPGASVVMVLIQLISQKKSERHSCMQDNHCS